MASTKEMAEAHLKNVENQIQQLIQQKVAIDSDIERLRGYLEEGIQELNLELSNPPTVGGSDS